ncbi:MAG: hypothetical protein J2P17_26080, partial [Mycobacterium sp.]|nr:hypothetical protein [Mycobacterium sp.]
MSTVVVPGAASPEAGVEAYAADRFALTRSTDAFPQTRRPLPWVLAVFVGLLFLVPLDSTRVRVQLPFDSTIDRAVVALMVLAWAWFGGDERTLVGRRRSKLVPVTMLLFLAVAFLSVILDSSRLANLGEFGLAGKKLMLECSYVAVGLFAMTALRPEDLRGFSRYLVRLASVLAIGVIVERRTGFNPFYTVSHLLLSPIATVGPAPTDIHPINGVRVAVVGPTIHGLALTTMLVMAMPFAILGALDAPQRRSRRWYLLALLLIFGGAVATAEKTSVLAPAMVIGYLFCHRPRKILKLFLPLSVVLVLVIHMAAPGSLGSILNIGAGLNSASTASRANDFGSALPDIMANPVFGRGFGSIDPTQIDQFRVLDDEYLGEAISVGLVGLACYLLMLCAPVFVAEKAAR